MHPQLTLIVAPQHIADLRRAADHDRLVHTATAANRSDTPTPGRPVAAPPVALIRRLLCHLAQTHPAGR